MVTWHKPTRDERHAMVIPAFIILFGGATLGGSQVLHSRVAHYIGLVLITLGTLLAMTTTFN